MVPYTELVAMLQITKRLPFSDPTNKYNNKFT